MRNFLVGHSLHNRKHQNLPLLGPEDLKRFGGFRCFYPVLHGFQVAAGGLYQNVFKRIRRYPPVLKSDPVYQPSLRDHRYKCRLRGLRFVKAPRILPDIYENFLRSILGIIGISKHLFGQRPDKAAVTVYTVFNGRPVTRCDSFQDGLSHNIPVSSAAGLTGSL
jgi:hypothetical protein